MKKEFPVPDLNSMTDPDKVRGIMNSAERLGRSDVYWMAFNRLCQLEGIDENDPLTRDFQATLRAYEELLTRKNGRTTIATRTRQKLKNKGLLQCLEDWALSKQPTTGFDLLIENDQVKLTAEYLVLQYSDRFTEEAVAAASGRLEPYLKDGGS